MGKPGSSLQKMTAVRKKRAAGTASFLRGAGKSLSAGSRAGKKAWRSLNRKPKGKKAAPAREPVERRQPVPMTPEAVKVRAVAIVAAVAGGLLSLVVAPVGSVICLAGIAVAVMARGVAALFFGGLGDDE